jgi:hypothetical protein
MEPVDAEDLEREVFELPVINPWRHRPSREQIRFAMDLCHSELPAPSDAETIARLRDMSSHEVSTLIRSLKISRAKRLRDAPRNRQWRLAPLGGRR